MGNLQPSATGFFWACLNLLLVLLVLLELFKVLNCIKISHYITGLALNLFLSSLITILKINSIKVLLNIVILLWLDLGLELRLDDLLLLGAGFGNLGGIDIGAATDGLVLLGTGLSNKGGGGNLAIVVVAEALLDLTESGFGAGSVGVCRHGSDLLYMFVSRRGEGRVISPLTSQSTYAKLLALLMNFV